jgi:hypothetical protein
MKVCLLNKLFLRAAPVAVGILGDTAVRAQPAVEAWVQRYNGPTGASDTGVKVVGDSSGNVIVAGNSGLAGGLRSSWAIIKYSSAGVPLWMNRYAGSGGYGDIANAVAVDSNGNVAVTGTSDYSAYVTIKYSSAGVPLWTNRYSDSFWNVAYAVAVDGSGNVVVTGDGPTIKYSSAGVPLWTNRPAAKALAVDGNGDVIVAGTSYSNDTSYDYRTIKYSSAGVPLWTNRYNGPGNDDDRAYAVAVDASGNVFVTGGSDTNASPLFYNLDYATIAYSNAGMPLWTNRYNGDNGSDWASALAVDGTGNVFVAGSSAIIKYSSAGVPLWTNRYNAPGDDYVALAVDGSGHVLLSGVSTNGGGYDYVTIKYSNAGVPLWTNRYNGPANSYDSARAVAVDGSDNVLVTGFSEGIGSGYDYATIKYSSAGVPLWTNRYNGPGSGDDQASALALARSGNVLVTGSSYGTNGFSDYSTIAYSGVGAPLWTNRYNGGNGNDSARALAMDGSGNVFVTGGSASTNGYGYTDYATVAYSSAGLPLWTNRYSEANGSASASAVAVDGSGNVFVTGLPATIKYSGAGLPLWTNRSSWPWSASGFAPAVAMDSGGNVFVTGASYVNFSYYDYATIKYSGAGLPLWTNRYNAGWDGYGGFPSALAVDGSGNVFVTGRLMTGSSYDYATIKYSNAGAPLWTNRYDGPGNTDDAASSLALDGSGNVFVTGGSGRITNHTHLINYATVAYSSEGVPLWTNRYPGSGYGETYATSVAVDGSGNVFVTGSSDGDYVTIQYSNAGVPLWTNRYNGLGYDYEPGGAVAVAVDATGNAFVTGYSASQPDYVHNYDYVTIKYSSASPLLTIARTTTNTLALSWPSPAADFTLQQNTNVVSTNWVTVGITPADDGTNKTVIFDPPDGNRFYRLARP